MVPKGQWRTITLADLMHCFDSLDKIYHESPDARHCFVMSTEVVYGELRGECVQGVKLTRRGHVYDMFLWDVRGNYDGGDKRLERSPKDKCIETFKDWFNL